MNTSYDSTRIRSTVKQSQELLTHYLTLALDKPRDPDVRAEIESILPFPFDELLERIEQLEQRVAVLESAVSNKPTATPIVKFKLTDDGGIVELLPNGREGGLVYESDALQGMPTKHIQEFMRFINETGKSDWSDVAQHLNKVFGERYEY